MKDVVITPYRDGPLLVRGPVRLTDQDGNEIAVDRETIALCRCGKSRLRPFCDGTHKLVRFRAPSGAEHGRRPRGGLVSARDALPPARRRPARRGAHPHRLRRRRRGLSHERAGQSTPAAASCDEGRSRLKTGGQLTVGTDKPAFPPYFEDDDPTNGKGFESAVAYAIADELGFDKTEVKWTVVPFNASYKPGPKDFDFDVNQISINDQRKRAVDFSEPYYTGAAGGDRHQGLAGGDATSLADLSRRQIGVQIGTTSLDAVTASIKPTKQPKVFDDSNAVVTALKQGQVDAVVTDLPTALYLTAVEMPERDASSASSAPRAATSGARCWRRTRR